VGQVAAALVGALARRKASVDEGLAAAALAAPDLEGQPSADAVLVDQASDLPHLARQPRLAALKDVVRDAPKAAGAMKHRAMPTNAAPKAATAPGRLLQPGVEKTAKKLADQERAEIAPNPIAVLRQRESAITPHLPKKAALAADHQVVVSVEVLAGAVLVAAPAVPWVASAEAVLALDLGMPVLAVPVLVAQAALAAGKVVANKVVADKVAVKAAPSAPNLRKSQINPKKSPKKKMTRVFRQSAICRCARSI
jgi:hypothetical protein